MSFPSIRTANYHTGFALRIGLRSHKVTGRVRVGVKTRAVALAAGSVWFANQGSGTVVRVHGR